MWARFNDETNGHPKLAMAGAFAELVWRRSICWCAHQLTDGFVPAAQLAALCAGLPEAPEVLAQRLVDAKLPGRPHGLWETVPGGWLVHDFLDENLSRAEVEKQRKAKSKAGRKGARKRWNPEAEGKSMAAAIKSASHEHDAPSRPVSEQIAGDDGPPAVVVAPEVPPIPTAPLPPIPAGRGVRPVAITSAPPAPPWDGGPLTCTSDVLAAWAAWGWCVEADVRGDTRGRAHRITQAGAITKAEWEAARKVAAKVPEGQRRIGMFLGAVETARADYARAAAAPSPAPDTRMAAALAGWDQVIKGTSNRARFSELVPDPIARQVVATLGGTSTLCAMPADKLARQRGDFLDRYIRAADQQGAAPPQPRAEAR